ncbi:ABC transporter substrate-binding protein [uncultured Microbacterium sp.]|uniref:ABC transporter substrate-binding protein n=1 Tax=uncultured Microbacterium sp. TaxID=191216 RepID=UPI0035CBECC6
MRTHHMTRIIAAAAAAASLTLLVAGCSASGTSGSGDSTAPIVVSSLNSLSGPVVVEDSELAAKAYFDEYNAAGGFNGRTIDFQVVDDKTDPATASSAARDAVENQGAVAIVGGFSNVDCAVNGAYYAQSGIVNIPGAGADEVCFTSSHIAPTNPGPFKGARLTLDLADELGLKSICGVLGVGGGAQAAFEKTFAQWTADTGHTFTSLDFIPYGAPDFTPYVIKAKEAGCDTFFFNGQTPLAVSIMNAAKAQNVDFTYLLFTSSYTDDFAAAAPDTGNGVYIVAEYAPYIDVDGDRTAEWKRVMTTHNVPLTGFAQAGYVAAHYFTEMLKTIDGDITKESVAKAFLEQKDGIEDSMVGSPFIFGPGDAHNSNDSGWAVKLEPGSPTWTNVSEDWLHLK